MAASGQGLRDQRAEPEGVLAVLGPAAQFVVATAAWPVAAQIMVLGLVHVVNCAVVYTGVGVGAGPCSAPVHRRPAGSAASPGPR